MNQNRDKDSRLSERSTASRQSRRSQRSGTYNNQPDPPVLPIGTNAVGSYNSGGDIPREEDAPPVLPEMLQVPSLLREVNSEHVVEEKPGMGAGIVRMTDMQRKVRDLELQLIDSKA